MKRLFLIAGLMVVLAACKEEKPVTIEKQVLQQGRFQLAEGKCAEQDSDWYNDCLCEGDVTYPQIRGMEDEGKQQALNALLKKPVETAGCPEGKSVPEPSAEEKNSEPAHQDLAGGYEVTHQTPRVLSILYHTYSYTGGAHGNTAIEGKVIDLKTGKEFALTDLVANQAQANAEILRQLKGRDEGEIFPETLSKEPAFIKDGQCDACVLVLRPNALAVIFQTYGVGPYSSGNIEVTLPPSMVANATVRDALGKK